MSTGFKRTGSAVGANAPSSAHASKPKHAKAPKSGKHSTTPHDTEFRRPGTTVGPSGASHSTSHSSPHPSSHTPSHSDHHHHHSSSVHKQAKDREKLDREAHKGEQKTTNHSHTHNHNHHDHEKKKKDKNAWEKFMEWLFGNKKKHKHHTSIHDTGFHKTGSSGVGPHTSAHGHTAKHDTHVASPHHHSISPQDTNFKRSVASAPLEAAPRKTVYTSSPTPHDTGFKKTGSEIGPSNARANNELAYHHVQRASVAPPVNAANPASYVSFCDQCGHRLPSVAKFCDNCGVHL